MSRTRSLVIALSLALVACKGESDAADKQAAPAPAPAPAPEQAGPAPQPAQPTPDEVTPPLAGSESDSGDEEDAPLVPVPATFETIGIAECDGYVTAHLACIDTKVPEAEREAARRKVFETVEVWRQTAAGGASAQKGLSTACRIALEQAKRETQNLGCEW
jgi:hypothetical protein